MMYLAQSWAESICKDKISANCKLENQKLLNGQQNQEVNNTQKKLNWIEHNYLDMCIALMLFNIHAYTL